MVGCDDEDGVLEPFLLLCLLEEEAQSIVRILDTAEYSYVCGREFILISLWNSVWRM